MTSRWMRAPVLSLVLLTATASVAAAEDDPYYGMDAVAIGVATNGGESGAEGAPSNCPNNVFGAQTGWGYSLFGSAERTVTLTGEATVNAQFGVAGGSATAGISSSYTYNEGTYIGPNGIRITINCSTGIVIRQL